MIGDVSRTGTYRKRFLAMLLSLSRTRSSWMSELVKSLSLTRDKPNGTVSQARASWRSCLHKLVRSMSSLSRHPQSLKRYPLSVLCLYCFNVLA